LKGNIGDDSIAGPTGRAQAKIAAHQNLFTAMGQCRSLAADRVFAGLMPGMCGDSGRRGGDRDSVKFNRKGSIGGAKKRLFLAGFLIFFAD
jgi:hypothetical protein